MGYIKKEECQKLCKLKFEVNQEIGKLKEKMRELDDLIDIITENYY